MSRKIFEVIMVENFQKLMTDNQTTDSGCSETTKQDKYQYIHTLSLSHMYAHTQPYAYPIQTSENQRKGGNIEKKWEKNLTYKRTRIRITEDF